jgi:hypothetical protein
MLPPSTLRPNLLSVELFRSGTGYHTLVKLSDEVVGNSLELCLVDSEEFLQSLDFAQEILWHIGHGA